MQNDMRDRLIELLKQTGMLDSESRCEIAAEELLANGVIVPPVKLDQTVYVVIHDLNEVKEGFVTKLEYDWCAPDRVWIETIIGKTYFPLLQVKCPFEQIGSKTVFLSREEAEQALRERESNA